MILDDLKDLLGTKPGPRKTGFVPLSGGAPANDVLEYGEYYAPAGPPPERIPLGRRPYHPESHANRNEPLESALSLRKIPLTSLGYDSRGRYFGVGAPIWHATTSFGQVDFTVRAPSRQEAKRIVRETYPNARFLR